ncbi:hypothetical protein [Pseudoalteromonas luteoviolacea]|uniref:Fibronectin type-III domain-containing protein n=1 Tax=Pseudoalteromonas luteoviolacea S4060-1 TaxID=1365257 RepID=A0A167PCA4_9GAMM|nr:hypothetical protein [Pseudoalteromonas luteoviolacea]KZN70335.1 hypothetical protein N478_00095 [Pseudoalteromonas luteoviolacea S4060-1]
MNRVLFVFILYMYGIPASASFEQAYIPINTGGTTILVPIEKSPETVKLLSFKSSENVTEIAWSPTHEAQYYQLQYLSQGEWKSSSDRLLLPYYRQVGITGPFRVRGCNRYGCAQWQTNNRRIQKPLHVPAFYTNNAKSDSQGAIQVSWFVEGATSLTLLVIEGSTVVRRIDGLHPIQGEFTTRIKQLSQITLRATGFNGEFVDKSLIATTAPKLPIKLSGVRSNYKQPLYETDLDIIEKSIIEYQDNLIFSTHDGLLVFYKATRNHNQEIDWAYQWHIELEGAVNNAPLIDGDFLYFTESNYDSTGRVCRIRWQDALGKVCTNKVSSSLLASPVLVNAVNTDTNPSFFELVRQFAHSFSSNRREIESGLYIFHENGMVEVLDPVNDLQVKRRFSIRGSIDTTLGISITPTLVMNLDYPSYHPQFIIQQDKDLIGVHVPATQSSESEMSVFNTMSRWFSGEKGEDEGTQNTKVQAEAQAVQELQVVWRDSL